MIKSIEIPDGKIGLDATPPQMQDAQIKTREIPLKGKLYTADDGIVAGENFTVLKNFKYMDIGLEGIYGMSKINTTALTTYLKSRSAIHFQKNNPAESHVITEAWNTGLTAAQVIQNTTAIPSAGDFSSTALWTTASGSGIGRFALVPGGYLAYANGKEACLWGGDEARVACFMQHDPNGTYSYDWTDQVRNTLTDGENIATLQVNTFTGNDSYTKLLLHFDGADTSTVITDASGSVHGNATIASHAQLDTGISPKFGTASLLLDGTDDYIYYADHADWSFGAGDFTIDFWYNANASGITGTHPICSQYQDANNWWSMYFYQMTLTRFVRIIFYQGGTPIAEYTSNILPTAETWDHYAFVRDGTNGNFYCNGVKVSTTANTAFSGSSGTYTGNLHIGTDGVGAYIYGSIDEFRISKGIARWTTNFAPEGVSYGSSATYLYVGATQPLNGVNLYINNQNTSNSTMAVDYWSGTWTSVPATFVDGSASGGKTLRGTGKKSITFGSTVATAKMKLISGKLLFWYRIIVDAISVNTQIYYVTLSSPFQKVRDIWDGANTLLQGCQLYTTAYADYTLNVQENVYDASDVTTYMELDSLVVLQYFVCGFLERQQGISISFAAGKANTTAATQLTVKYWNGMGWIPVSGQDDGTSKNGISFAQDGTITWDPPSVTDEFKTNISNTFHLCYYLFTFDKPLSSDVQIFFIRGIPASKGLYNFNFPFCGGDRTWLCNQNSALCSAQNSPNIFNGEDSFTIPFGDDRSLTAAAEVYCQFGANLYMLLLFTKVNETWIIYQDANAVWQKFRVSGSIGCSSYGTMKSTNITPDTVIQNGTIAIWQGAHGIYMFDGKSLTALHNDIKNYFDRKKSECITSTMIDKSYSFFNDDETHYHWCFASGSGQTTLNKELVYDIARKKWFEVVRTSGKELQVGITVEDTYGNRYNYGFLETGYMERLESGYTMDGAAIPYQFTLGDVALADGHIMLETVAKAVGMACIGNTLSYDKVTVSHYADTYDESATAVLDPRVDGNKRIRDVVTSAFDRATGPAVYHKLDFSFSTSTEPYGLRPKYVYVHYEPTKLRGI